jgi:hypothetical protein
MASLKKAIASLNHPFVGAYTFGSGREKSPDLNREQSKNLTVPSRFAPSSFLIGTGSSRGLDLLKK